MASGCSLTKARWTRCSVFKQDKNLDGRVLAELSHWRQDKKALANSCLASYSSCDHVRSFFCLFCLFIAKDLVITFKCISFICISYIYIHVLSKEDETCGVCGAAVHSRHGRLSMASKFWLNIISTHASIRWTAGNQKCLVNVIGPEALMALPLQNMTSLSYVKKNNR